MEKCPRFKFCSVNICPLDKLSSFRNKLKDEPSCTLAKSIRQKIGTEYGLPKLGLNNAEFSAFQKWKEKSEEEKTEIRKRMAKVREKLSSQNSL